MLLKAVICVLSLSETLAYPLNSDIREATWAHPNANQAHDKTDLTKDVHRIYKSVIDSSDLYNQDEDAVKSPVAEEMKHKLAMESERLRVRLRQELADLRLRLSPSPAHLSATLASMRERLTPLTQQLQSSLSSNTQDLCNQLSLYLHNPETGEAQTEASPAPNQDTFHWISQTLEHSSLQLANAISDFHTAARDVAEGLKEASDPEDEANDSKLWQTMNSKLRQEAGALREEVQSRVGVLKAQLAALLESSPKSELLGSVEQFCQNAALQNQELQTRMERLVVEVEEEVLGASPPPLPPSLSSQEGGSLQEDFSVKLSALIQDILHSMQ
ncbi:apolipoprotein A-IV [Nematolebias whitei]|uniref:apolipoprotein A-IV n=1 Tax=Nematolebias whitei TaxID=451745 RepID=UPI00189AEA67|nr:apolipoprotein A-IV [Nematolebias whitei]